MDKVALTKLIQAYATHTANEARYYQILQQAVNGGRRGTAERARQFGQEAQSWKNKTFAQIQAELDKL